MLKSWISANRGFSCCTSSVDWVLGGKKAGGLAGGSFSTSDFSPGSFLSLTIIPGLTAGLEFPVSGITNGLESSFSCNALSSLRFLLGSNQGKFSSASFVVSL